MDVDGDLLARLALGVLAGAVIALALAVVMVIIVEVGEVIYNRLLRRTAVDRLLESTPDVPYEELRSGGGGGGATSAADDDDGRDRCVICQADYEAGERCFLLPACRHVFHKACVAAWLRKRATCPLCRDSVVPVVPEQQWQLDAAETMV